MHYLAHFHLKRVNKVNPITGRYGAGGGGGSGTIGAAKQPGNPSTHDFPERWRRRTFSGGTLDRQRPAGRYAGLLKPITLLQLRFSRRMTEYSPMGALRGRSGDR